MSKAHAGHIIVKGDKKGEAPSQRRSPMNTRRFFTQVDKGSSRPAFCLPRHMDAFKETTEQMERALEGGHITADRRMDFEAKLKQHQNRLAELQANKQNAANIINEDPDAWHKRRNELAEEIRDAMPSRTDNVKKRVNPFSNLKREKSGLEAKKQEYIIISKAMQAAGHEVESNVSFLEKD